MGQDSKIEWTHHTFNPWRGCTKVSPGCANCYAEKLSHRNPGTLGVWGPQGTRTIAAEASWREPLKWNKVAEFAADMYAAIKDDPKYAGRVIYEGRPRVFCASLADVFEDWQGPVTAVNGNPLWWCYGSLSNSPIPSTGLPEGCRMACMDDVRRRLFALIADTPDLDWLLLTKRPENALRMMVAAGLYAVENPNLPCTQRNLWLGTSIENQETANERIPHLLQVPAAVRFLSVEPLLDDIDLRKYLTWTMDVHPTVPGKFIREPSGIHWVIVGGESGPGARPCRVEWVRSIVRQCEAAGVPVFAKQLGSLPVSGEGRRIGPRDAEDFPRCWRCGHFDFGPCGDGTLLCNGCDAAWDRLRDKKGGDPAEWPADLRVREFPHVTAKGC